MGPTRVAVSDSCCWCCVRLVQRLFACGINGMAFHPLLFWCWLLKGLAWFDDTY